MTEPEIPDGCPECPNDDLQRACVKNTGVVLACEDCGWGGSPTDREELALMLHDA